MKIRENLLYYKEYYRTMDGSYNSFWVGKLINKFVKKGQKLTIENKFKKVYMFSKLHLNKNFHHLFLEKIERIRPIFKLKSKLIAGTLKDYPVIINKDKSRSYATNNFYNSIFNRKEWNLEQRVLNDFIDLNKNKKTHHLLAKHEDLLTSAINNRFHVRFGRPRIKRR